VSEFDIDAETSGRCDKQQTTNVLRAVELCRFLTQRSNEKNNPQPKGHFEPSVLPFPRQSGPQHELFDRGGCKPLTEVVAEAVDGRLNLRIGLFLRNTSFLDEQIAQPAQRCFA